MLMLQPITDLAGAPCCKEMINVAANHRPDSGHVIPNKLEGACCRIIRPNNTVIMSCKK